MTVIIGARADAGEKGVVIAADKMQISKDYEDILEYIEYAEHEDPKTSLFVIKTLTENTPMQMECTQTRKIVISKNRQRAISHAGVHTKDSQKKDILMLEPEEFLKDKDYLKKIIFPIDVPESDKIVNEYISNFVKSFDLDKRILSGYIPEIQRISEYSALIKSNERFKGKNIILYEPQFATTINEFIYSPGYNNNELSLYPLIAISGTGVSKSVAFTAVGSGGNDAREFIRKKIGMSYSMPIGASKNISIKNAVEIATGAVLYANEMNDFCSGLDYIIITKDGIEEHFSPEVQEKNINFERILEKKIEQFERNIHELKEIKKKYINIRYKNNEKNIIE